MLSKLQERKIRDSKELSVLHILGGDRGKENKSKYFACRFNLGFYDLMQVREGDGEVVNEYIGSYSYDEIKDLINLLKKI